VSVNYELVQVPAAAPRVTAGGEVRAFIRGKPLGAAGALIIVGMAIVAIFANALAPYDPYWTDYGAQFARPSAEHWFGTDEFGRDVLSRIMYGARIALFVGFAASFAGCTIGALLGVISAYAGGVVDLLLERLMDVLLAFPLLILALAIASILGPAVPNVVIAIAIPIIPRAARVVRATALAVKENYYVEAARSLGASEAALVCTEVLPNLASSVVIYGTSLVGVNIVFTASLSALGLGVQPPDADWGRMISEGAKVLVTGSPGVATFPALAVLLVALAFNWLGDGLRDVLNP
jgi:peptide/nickel transport system permease protein